MSRKPAAAAESLREQAHRLIPGGSHTYAKGDDQFPRQAPAFLVRGEGCHVWDLEGNRYIEYGMGLRAVTLGHAFAPVVEAATRELRNGVNFSRPSPIEVECAEEFQSLIPTAEMVKFCKDGSHAVDGAVRLARACTGRDMIAFCGDHPFFSTSDWFIGATDMNAGIPEATRKLVVKFRYNDLPGLEALFAEHRGRIACVVMEAARTEEPAAGYLEGVKQLTHAQGALLIFDEMITGFRWHLQGAQHVYRVTPDLCAFGKGLGNGFSVSALAGRRELMKRGGWGHDEERVFLLSTTHGAETHALAASLATMRYYREHPVIETLYRQGARLRRGVDAAIEANGLGDFVGLLSRDCNLIFFTRDAERKPSQPFRTLFLQELAKRGILAPSFVVSYSHSDEDIDATIAATTEALAIYRRALDEGVDRFLEGPAVKPVSRRFA
jgi:glutamate-1-semialdehyde 2,1-aminomutase